MRQTQLYNAVGQLTRSISTPTPTFKWGGTTTYAYDNRSQLTQESSSRGVGYTDNFGYAGTGNLSSWKGINRAYNTDNQEVNRSQPVAYLYDGAGNTTQLKNYNLATPTVAAPTQKLIYNAQGQLAELRDANNVLIATYVYRGDGKRAWKQLANGTRSYFYYLGDKLTAATNGVDTSSLVLWGADGIVGSCSYNSTTGTVTKFYNLYDTQGNLVQTIDAANGNVVGQNALTAWGEPIRDSAGNLSGGGGYGAKFGYVRDGESGFYLCTLRYYDPSAGRWITRDPIGYAGGSNLYGYVGNDLVNATDPSGLHPIGDIMMGPGGSIIWKGIGSTFARKKIGPGLPQELLTHYTWSFGKPFHLSKSRVLNDLKPRMFSLTTSSKFMSDINAGCSSSMKTYTIGGFDLSNGSGGLGYYTAIVTVHVVANGKNWRAYGQARFTDYWDFDVSLADALRDYRKQGMTGRNPRTAAGATLSGTPFWVTTDAVTFYQDSTMFVRNIQGNWLPSGKIK